jgi:tRNA uridine 5-carboxymethylaminomethyl modification enzyme
VTKGVSEPYRMFTSRAEYRLSLRADNADERLTPKGLALGLVGTERAEIFATREALLAQARERARGLALTSAEAQKAGLKVNQDGKRRSALDLIAAPDVGYDRVAELWPEFASLPRYAREALEADALYSGYLARQEADIVALRRDESLTLPATVDYKAIPSLSAELRQKLERVRPASLGQAARIDGMTPAALTAILGHVRRYQIRESA